MMTSSAPPTTPPTSIWQAKGTLLLVLLLLALAGGEIAASLKQHADVPSDKAWAALAGQVRAQRRAGEPVLIAPAWIEPLARYHLGSQLELELQLLSDVDRYPRVWEVSARGRHHPWLSDLRPKRSWDYDGLTLSLYEKPAREVLFDFTRQIETARVERVGDDLVRCALEGKRFMCDKEQRWNWVGSYLAEVGHRPFRCIYAHAVENHLMRVSFDRVPLGSELRGYTGIDDFENRKRAQAPVLLTVRVDDEVVGSIRHLNDSPWRRFQLDTSRWSGKTADVKFEITTDAAYARVFCFAAETRR